MTFGQVVSQARKEMGISQRDLALRILKEDGASISPQYLNDIERDRRNPPGDHLLEQFARELQLDIDYLYFLSGKLPSELRSRTSSPQQVKQAFRAFRCTLRGGR
jgi:transcriptional regulator with XRE-family HTH domain